jgi:serine/threonine-protein kinase HipA
MGRRPHTRRLALWMNGERVGTWSVSPAGDELSYDTGWLDSPQARPLSLSLPFQPGNPPHKGAAVRAWFDNLLPDSQPIRDRLARRFRTATAGAFDLLAEIGRDCVGALQIVPEGRDPGDVKAVHARPLDEAGVARALRAALAPGTADVSDGRSGGFDDFRISIAGVQEKTALLWRDGRWWLPQGTTPTTHILKLPLGLVGNLQLDLRDSVENEWLCAQILDAYGLAVARCHPLTFEDRHVLGVERFDRRWSDDGSWLVRLPQEDFCQATGTPSHLKYEADGGPGIDRGLDLLNASRRRARDRETFFRAQLVFWLLCAPDGHAKNFSLALHAGGSFSLAPLYDVMSAYPVLGAGPGRIPPHKVRLAMALRCGNAHWRMHDMRRRHWEEVGRRNGVVSASGQGVDTLIDDLVDRTPGVVESVAARLPPGFPGCVADAILSGLAAAAGRLGTA